LAIDAHAATRIMRRTVPTPPSHPLLIDLFMNLTAKDNCTKALSLLVDASKQVRIPLNPLTLKRPTNTTRHAH
jgi:hypothetical protein